MRKIIFTVAAMLFATCGMAQKTVVTTGGSAMGNSASVSYSVGQIATGMAHTADFKMFEGVQQPIQVSEMSIDEALRLNVEMKVYPNPTADAVCLYRVDEQESQLTYTLFSADGAEIMKGVLEDVSTTISLQSLSSAVYVLRVTNGKLQRAYRIVKK